MKDIKRRLERLEQATMPDEDRKCLIVLCKAWSSGTLTALTLNRNHDGELRFPRLEAETEQVFYDRVEAEIKEMKSHRTKDGRRLYVLTEDREQSAEEKEYSDRYDRKQAANRAQSESSKTPTEQPVREAAKPDPEPEPRRPYVPERRPEPRQVIEIKREIGPTAGHWLTG